jgi:D-sedoheptulose 7-phosphate isomerase
MHFVQDINKVTRYCKAYCLGSNPFYLSAVANDISYEDIFLEEFKKLKGNYNILICLSCSGESINILKAVQYLIDKDLGEVFAITGNDNSTLAYLCHNSIDTPAQNIGQVESIHSALCHYIVDQLKDD